jgi:hypothetical protein
MKSCPQCKSTFPDEERFCELDGTPLVSEDASLPTSVSSPSRPRTNSILIVAAVLGLVVGVLPVLLYVSLTGKGSVQNANHLPANSTIAQPQFPTQLSQPAPVASTSPSVEPSPSPSPVSSPSLQSSPKRIELSSSPISTAAGGKDKTGPVVIKLQTGVTIEADEVWQTGEGIWYRRGSIVSVIDPKEVKTIERSKPQSAPSPLPTASPQPSLQ